MRLVPYLRRTLRVAALTAEFAVSFAFARVAESDRRPRLLKRYFERAGAGFVKLGQVLATRYDLLPAAYCEELATLLDRLPASDVRAIVQTIEEDLGRPVEELFREFDPEPLSSASVAQVHAATLATGERVVVKVMHPGVDTNYRIDLRNLRYFASVASYFGLLHRVDVAALVREFERLALEELDFLHEARNIHVLHELLESDDIDHCGPGVYLELSGRSVITMQRLDGVWVREMLEAIARGDAERLREWRRMGITPGRTARLLFRSMLEQCFTHRIFHADPHAGNLVVMPGGTLGYVDFGMVGWMDERLWTEQYALNEAIARGNIHQAYEALLDTLEPLPDRDLSHFETEVKALLMEWIFATKVPGTPIEDRASATLFLRLFGLMRWAGLHMRLGSLRLSRALMISDVIALKLYPEMDRMTELVTYFNERAQTEFTNALHKQLSGTGLYSTALGLNSAVETLPRAARWLVKRLPEYGRRYEAAWSMSERVAMMVIRYLRNTAALAVVALVGGGLAGAFGEWWWWVAVASLITALLLGRILSEFEET